MCCRKVSCEHRKPKKKVMQLLLAKEEFVGWLKAKKLSARKTDKL